MYRVYAATKSSGVYYSSDFELDSSNPTWTAINTGLPSTNIWQFMVDYVNPERTQYAIDSGSYDLYRRQDANDWELILSSADARTLTSETDGYIRWVTSDEENEGIIYVLFSEEAIFANHCYILKSDDFGDTWSILFTKYFGLHIYDNGNVIARGDTVWFTVTAQLGAYRVVYHVVNGVEEASYTQGSGGGNLWLRWCDDTDKDKVFAGGAIIGGNFVVIRLESSGGVISSTTLSTIYVMSEGGMWYSPTNSNHSRFGNGTEAKIKYTLDDWSSETSTTFGGLEDVMMLANVSDNETVVVVGISASGVLGSTKYPLLYLEDYTSTTPINKSGSDWNVVPYSNSIPVCNVSNGICHLGVYIIPAESEKRIYVHAVEGVPNLAVEEPLPGDRSAFDELQYPHLHSSGLQSGTYIHHVPSGTTYGDMLMWDGFEWTVIAGGSIIGETLLDDDGITLLDDDLNILVDG